MNCIQCILVWSSKSIHQTIDKTKDEDVGGCRKWRPKDDESETSAHPFIRARLYVKIIEAFVWSVSTIPFHPTPFHFLFCCWCWFWLRHTDLHRLLLSPTFVTSLLLLPFTVEWESKGAGIQQCCDKWVIFILTYWAGSDSSQRIVHLTGSDETIHLRLIWPRRYHNSLLSLSPLYKHVFIICVVYTVTCLHECIIARFGFDDE